MVILQALGFDIRLTTRGLEIITVLLTVIHCVYTYKVYGAHSGSPLWITEQIPRRACLLLLERLVVNGQ